MSPTTWGFYVIMCELSSLFRGKCLVLPVLFASSVCLKKWIIEAFLKSEINDYHPDSENTNREKQEYRKEGG